MIIKGGAAGNVNWWSGHLLRDDTNDRAEIKETRGVLGQTVYEVLREMQAVASGSRSQGNFMYQANINPRDNEHLTPDQWREAVDTLEKNLGLEGHQRIVIEHEKEGRVHRHVVWNRADVDTMRVTDITDDWRAHDATSRQLEERFGLARTKSAFEPRREDERKPATHLWEIRAAQRSGIDRNEMKAELTGLWRTTDSGKAFTAAIEERGYRLAEGRRGLVVVDHAGDVHSLARRLDGVRAKGVQERMSDIDRTALPSAEEARKEQRAKYSDGKRFDRDAAFRAWESRPGASKGPALQAEQTTDRDMRPAARPAREHPAAQERSSFQVAGKAAGAASRLADFVGNLLAGDAFRERTQRKPSQAEQIVERRRAAAALDNIRTSVERGDRLRPEDIQNLTPTHLENIRAKGDAYMRTLIEQHERDRSRASDWGRERER